MNQHQRKFAVEKIQSLQADSGNKIRTAMAVAREANGSIINADRLCRDALRRLTKTQLVSLFTSSFKAQHVVNRSWHEDRHEFTVKFGDKIKWADSGYMEKFADQAREHDNVALVHIADTIRVEFEEMIARKEKADKAVEAKYDPMLDMIETEGRAAATQVMLYDGPEAMQAIEAFTKAISNLKV